MTMTILLPVLGFVFISLLVYAASLAFAPSGGTSIERRLGEVRATRTDQSEEPPADRTVIAALKRLGAMAPRSAKELGKLQQRLVTAGYRSREALVIFFGIRLGLAVLGFAVAAAPIMGRPNLLMALTVCGVGYVLPSMILARLAKRRQHQIRLGLPDALDLLVVSVEAGLGLDQALQRVAEELAFAHPDLCDELRLINLELRAGTGRAEALHNLARRTGLDDIASLVTMLVQTDKFGTSVAQSLRVHSETLRTKRRQRAEEAAAKTGAKMVFPLVICIFPAIWVVTLGSAVIKFIQVLMPMAQP
ncbi:MAG TPA: type II secretion system F family protein [Vicinamibacterales bacterium]|jgi:tight adherence protein C